MILLNFDFEVLVNFSLNLWIALELFYEKKIQCRYFIYRAWLSSRTAVQNAV